MTRSKQLTSHELVFSLDQLVFVAAHLFVVPSDELPQVQLADTPLLLAERSLLSQAREPRATTFTTSTTTLTEKSFIW